MFAPSSFSFSGNFKLFTACRFVSKGCACRGDKYISSLFYLILDVLAQCLQQSVVVGLLRDFKLEANRLRVVAHRAARPRRVPSYEETSKKRRFSCQPFVFKQTLAGGSALYRKLPSGACIATHQAHQNMTCKFCSSYHFL